MENYRKVHLRGVLINSTSRLRYSVHPEECGLSHCSRTLWVSAPLSQVGKQLPQPPKAILDFRSNQRSRSTPKVKNILTKKKVKQKAFDLSSRHHHQT